MEQASASKFAVSADARSIHLGWSAPSMGTFCRLFQMEGSGKSREQGTSKSMGMLEIQDTCARFDNLKQMRQSD